MSAAKLNVKTSPLPNSRLAVELEIPSERCKSSYEEAISRLSRTIRVPGFRQGKVPKAVILQQVGSERIQASAIETLLQRVWKEAVEKEKIESLSDPELTDEFESVLKSFNPEKNLTIKLETDIAPIPILKTTKGLTAEVEPIEFDSKKVDELIKQSQKQLATIIPIDNRPAEKGDIAVISFTGNYSDDGSEIEGGSAEDMDIELEEGNMIPGFVEGIIGMEINNTKILNCEFPDKYHQEEARGRKAEFKVILKDLKTKELPKLDDSFAQQASDKKTMTELRIELETRLKEDTKNRDLKNRQESLLKVLVEELEVELPKTLIDLEVRNIVEQTAQNFAQQGIDVKSMFTEELVKSLMESSRPEAEDKLRQKLALQALAKAENIEVSDEEVKTKMSSLQSEISKERKIDPQKLKQLIRDDLLQEKLFEWLMANNSVVEKEVSKKKSTKSTAKKDLPKTKKK